MAPLKAASTMFQMPSVCIRSARNSPRRRSAKLVATPAATAARMPETPTLSPTRYAANGRSTSSSTICVAATSPTRRVTLSRPTANAQPSAAPTARPPKATQRNSWPASAQEKAPVTVAATANLSATRPEASLSSDSPCNTCMVLAGMPRLRVMAATATASVGDTTAASANATVSGIVGIIQWMR